MPAKCARFGSRLIAMPWNRHAVPHANAERRDLVLAPLMPHPDADAAVAALALHVEARQGPDDPGLEVVHISSQVAAARGEIEHHVADALAGARDR